MITGCAKPLSTRHEPSKVRFYLRPILEQGRVSGRNLQRQNCMQCAVVHSVVSIARPMEPSQCARSEPAGAGEKN